MPNKYDEADSRADVAIIGLGPGGLAAALRAAPAKPPALTAPRGNTEASPARFHA